MIPDKLNKFITLILSAETLSTSAEEILTKFDLNFRFFIEKYPNSGRKVSQIEWHTRLASMLSFKFVYLWLCSKSRSRTYCLIR